MVETSTIPRIGVSAFELARLALVYIEAAADLSAELRYGDMAALKHLLTELTVRTSTKQNLPKKEAPQHLVKIIGEREKMVTGTAALYWRAYAWLKLVTVWCLARGEDSTWIDASSLTYSDTTGLNGVLSRTKTTVPGKKIRRRETSIFKEAYVLEEDWLRTGFEPGKKLRSLVKTSSPSLTPRWKFSENVGLKFKTEWH